MISCTTFGARTTHRACLRDSNLRHRLSGLSLRRFPGARHPDIELELICENRDSVVEHREADIAIRYVRPAQGQSAVRKIGELGSAAYAPKALLRPGIELASP